MRKATLYPIGATWEAWCYEFDCHITIWLAKRWMSGVEEWKFVVSFPEDDNTDSTLEGQDSSYRMCRYRALWLLEHSYLWKPTQQKPTRFKRVK